MRKISLLGPNYRDYIFDARSPVSLDVSNFGTWTSKMGGVFNVARDLARNFNLEIEITVAHQILDKLSSYQFDALADFISVEEAFLVDTTVILDKWSSTRTALVDLDKIPVKLDRLPGFNFSEILHIAYLDSLKISKQCLTELRSQFDMVVCDLSATSLDSEVVSRLEIVDALLCSSSEFQSLAKSGHKLAIDLKLPPFVCVHDPEYLLIIENGESWKMTQEKYGSLDTLGAGDAFAANFLGEVASGTSWRESAILANKMVRQDLSNQVGEK